MYKGQQHQSAAGKSLIQLLQEKLDEVISNLYDESLSDEYERLRGQAYGIAYALALIENPYLLDIELVKSKAMDRRQE